MNKPVLPVSDTWIRSITPHERFIAYTPLSHVVDMDLLVLDDRISVVGAFGRFLTIEFENRLYVMPVPMVQGLLWSFDQRLGHQFSDEEQRLLVDTCGHAHVTAKLEKELTALCAWLERAHGAKASVAREMHDTSCDAWIRDCPEPQFYFDEARS